MGVQSKLVPENVQNFLGLCNWTYDVASKDYNDYLELENKKMTIHSKLEYYTNPSLVDKQTGGDLKLRALIHALSRFDKLGWERSKHQIDFHKAFISAILKKIYGQEIHANLVRLLKEYAIDELRPDVVICTPRRYGKTTSVAMFVAAVLWAIPGFKIDIYSTGRRASMKLLALIYKFVTLLSGTDTVVDTYNKETLGIKTPSGEVSLCNSYPSKVQINDTTRKQPTTPNLDYFLFIDFFNRYNPIQLMHSLH